MKRILSKLWTGCKLPLAWMTHAVSYVFPRSRRIIIFSGLHRNHSREIFANNAKYQFLYLHNNVPDRRPIWIGRDKEIAAFLMSKGLESYYRFSLRGMWYSLRAGITVVDAFLTKEQWQFVGTSKIVQLWHGKGFKRTGHDSPYSLQRYNAWTSPQMLKKYDAIIAASPYIQSLMSTLFKEPKEKIHIAGLPRHDVLFANISNAALDSIPGLYDTIAKKRASGINKVILYAPTFHPNNKGGNPTDAANLVKLNEQAKEMRAYIYIQLHLKHVFNDEHDKRTFSNIGFLEGGFDMYPTLNCFDALITDYSSIMIDFLLVDKPVILFAYDLDAYSKTMGVYDEFYQFKPLVKTSEALQKELEAIYTDSFEHMEDQKRIKDLFFTYQDGNAAKRIYEEVIKKL